MNNSNAAAPTERRSRWTPKRIAVWATVGVLGAIGLFYGGVLIYANVINDAPDELSTSDLSDALGDDTTPDTAAPDTAPADTAAPDTAAPDTAAPDTAAPDTAAPVAGFDGTWVATTASEFGYRVDEVLGGVDVTAVGRSNEIDGTLEITGTSASISVSVDVATIASDNGSRDGQFRGRIMNVAEFPTATFVTTAPIEFGAIPAAGEQITATVTGELTLRGATQPVTFEVTAEATDDRIGVLGSIPVTFADYGIDNPSFGAVSVENEGLVEFVLVFERS